VESVDPDGIVAAHIEVERVIGSVVYPASELAAPGVIKVIEGNRFTLGELDGSKSPRLEALAQTLIRAGFKAPVSTDIRSEIWLKLWGNLSFNPISALTHATLVDICQFPLTRELAANMMREAQTVAEKLGVRFKVSLDKRIAGAEAVGKHKTSMLQDVEAGRPLELEALVGSVRELGRVTETPTPTIDAVYACASLLAKTWASRTASWRQQESALRAVAAAQDLRGKSRRWRYGVGRRLRRIPFKLDHTYSVFTGTEMSRQGPNGCVASAYVKSEGQLGALSRR
jgi:2-dehydropantoate 2-reductase